MLMLMHTNAKHFLGKIVPVKMDRPLGSKHPKHGYVYPVNYGFVPETKSLDGGELDAYVLGVDVPLEEFSGRCIAVVHRLDDDDDKLIVVPDGQSMTDDEICKAIHFQEQYFKSEVIRNEALYDKSTPQIVKEVGFDFNWDSKKVWALNEPTVEMSMSELDWHFDVPFWDSEGTDAYNLTPKEVMAHPDREPTHWRLIQEADTSYPIDIMENKGRWLILDGLHRLVKECLAGKTVVRVRKIPRSRIPEIEKAD
ncbi:MAG: inorganic diphosphatase [Patescibacteria group bacterium]